MAANPARADSGCPGSAPAGACVAAGAAEVRSRSSRCDFQTAASVCVPWPAVLSLSGSTTARPFGTRTISFSRICSSGGLIRSSAEFTARSGALIFSRSGQRIVVARCLQRVEDVVGVAGLHVVVDVGVDLLVGGGQRRRGLLPQDRVAAHEPQQLCRGTEAARLGRVGAVLPLGIRADRVDRRPPPHSVASGNLGRQAGERHQRVHHVRIALAPEPGVHSAHRGAHDETQMVDAESINEQAMLGFEHVEIPVLRELRAQSVTGLARLAVTDVVRRDDVELRGVERLPRPEQLIGERAAGELRAGAARPVHHQDGVADDALRVLLRRAPRPVMHLQLREGLARREPEVRNDEIRLGGAGRAGRRLQEQERQRSQQGQQHGHAS